MTSKKPMNAFESSGDAAEAAQSNPDALALLRRQQYETWKAATEQAAERFLMEAASMERGAIIDFLAQTLRINRDVALESAAQAIESIEKYLGGSGRDLDGKPIRAERYAHALRLLKTDG